MDKFPTLDALRRRAREIDACRQWLVAEMQALRPAMIVCLGATAAKAVFGSMERERNFPIKRPPVRRG
jgi:uracil-DNA glycosylase family 4